MANVRAGLPDGRYGRSAADQARTNRRLTIAGVIFITLLVAFLAWVGVSYLREETVSAELTTFDIVSSGEVEISLTVRKPAGSDAVCTVRAQAEDGLEVGRADFRFTENESEIHPSVTLKTTQRATAAELIECSEA